MCSTKAKFYHTAKGPLHPVLASLLTKSNPSTSALSTTVGEHNRFLIDHFFRFSWRAIWCVTWSIIIQRDKNLFQVLTGLHDRHPENRNSFDEPRQFHRSQIFKLWASRQIIVNQLKFMPSVKQFIYATCTFHHMDPHVSWRFRDIFSSCVSTAVGSQYQWHDDKYSHAVPVFHCRASQDFECIAKLKTLKHHKKSRPSPQTYHWTWKLEMILAPEKFKFYPGVRQSTK